MSNENIIPVNHDALSSVGTTAAEAGKGGLGGMWKGSLVALGIVVGLGALTGGALGIAGGIAAVGSGILVGAIAALGLSVVTIPFGGGILAIGATVGAAFGLMGGIAKGVGRVSQERGASEMLQAQVAAYQAQAAVQQPQTTVYTAPVGSNDNKFNFPAQGSAMNEAASSIQANSAQLDGALADKQLQRA